MNVNIDFNYKWYDSILYCLFNYKHKYNDIATCLARTTTVLYKDIEIS